MGHCDLDQMLFVPCFMNANLFQRHKFVKSASAWRDPTILQLVSLELYIALKKLPRANSRIFIEAGTPLLAMQNVSSQSVLRLLD